MNLKERGITVGDVLILLIIVIITTFFFKKSNNNKQTNFKFEHEINYVLNSHGGNSLEKFNNHII